MVPKLVKFQTTNGAKRSSLYRLWCQIFDTFYHTQTFLQFKIDLSPSSERVYSYICIYFIRT